MSEAPEWFNEDCVSKILFKFEVFPNVVKICSWTMKPATSKGENYVSLLNLLEVKYILSDGLEKSCSFIVKSRLEDEFIEAMDSDVNVFGRECQVYGSIIVEMEKLLRSIGDNTVFAPKAIYLDDRMIVMENMKEKGYSIGDVKVGLDKEQVFLIMKKLAKFHACSMVLHEKSPELFKFHLNGIMTEKENPLHIFFINSVETCIEYCSENTNLQKYVPKLKEFHSKVISKLVEVFTRTDKDKFHVLTHGDCWVNNFLFQNKAEDLVFVDFQEGYYGSPGIDFNYLFCSSLSKEVYIEHREDFLKKYHETLSSILNKLNYQKEIPTLEDVQQEIINKSYHGLGTVTGTLPVLLNLLPELDAMNFIADTDEAKESRIKFFNNPRYDDLLELFMEEFIKFNIFN